jgi:glyoxylase-like metal-dependent hydrolase (beta-lactamase superfamily II)
MMLPLVSTMAAALPGCALPTGAAPVGAEESAASSADDLQGMSLADIVAHADAAVGGANNAVKLGAKHKGSPAGAQLITQTSDASGSRFDPGQTFKVTDAPLLIQDFQFTRTHDLQGGRVRTAWKRSAGYPGQVPFAYTEVAGPGAGFFDAPHNFQELLSGVPQHGMSSATVDATLRNRELDEPQQLIAEALAHPNQVTLLPSQVVSGRQAFVLAFARPVSPIRLFIDALTFMPLQAARLQDDAVFGDADAVVRYDSFLQSSLVRVPSHLTTTLNGQLVQQEQRSQVTFAKVANVGQFDVPPALALPYSATDALVGDEHPELFDRGNSFGFEQGGRYTTVTTTSIAPGVVHLTGGTHHSMAIETDHGVVMVEGPNDDARSLAVLAAVEAAFPGKPITHIINTHHHHDHVGGLRTYISRGVPVVAPAVDLSFLAQVAAAPHTLRPDTLAQHPQAATFIGVGPSGWSVTDGRTVQVIPVLSGHAETMLVVYVPDAKVVFESDLYFPGFFPLDQPTPGPFGVSTHALYQQFVIDRGLDVQVVAGGHAGVADHEAFRINAGF